MVLHMSRPCSMTAFAVLAGLMLAAAPASAQFRDDFNGPSIHKDWTAFTGDGTATVELRQGDGCATMLVDATSDRANIWWAIAKRNIASSIDVKKLSEPGHELRLEARVRIFEAPRRVQLQANTQRTTNYDDLLMEFDIADTAWHTISWTTHGLNARPGDQVNVQFGISDWGLGKYRVEVDYLKADVVEAAKAGLDLGALPFHPRMPAPASFAERVPVVQDSTIDTRFPDLNLNGWQASEGDRKVPVVTVNGDQFVVLRWDLHAYAGRKVAGAGFLELTTHSAQTVVTEPEEFGQIRVTEILGGDPAWNRRGVTFNGLLKGQPIDTVLNPQMVLDERVAPRRGDRTLVRISRSVLQRLVDGRTLGLAIRPLGPIDASFYSSQHENRRLAPRLLFDVEERKAGEAGPLLDPVFQDHAVLQRDAPIRVWGNAGAGEQVTVTLGNGQAAARADASGRWSASLPAMAAGGPYSLKARTVSGRHQAATDVLVGDVWLCSGQSNMELAVARSRNGDFAAATAANDAIRLLTIPHLALPQPASSFDAPIAWQVATPQTVGSFSAACYYFGRELQQTLHVPMGLINSSWGGTAIETWIADAGLRTIGRFNDRLDLLPVYAREAEAANQRFGRMWQDWWRANAPGAGEPWQPASATDGWREVPEPMRNWKTWGVPELANHDGMVWYRRAFQLTAEQAARGATLSLGGIDEVDQTWVNGRVIRNTFGWGNERVYHLPAGVLHAGENVVVVNVLSTWDAGGMLGPADRLAVGFDDGSKVSLAGGWRYQVVPLGVGRPPRAPWEPIEGLTSLYNGMIAPLGHYGLRGALWYQGETNASAPAGYDGLLAALMSGWRTQFAPDLPFLIVQLPGFGPVPTSPVESGWAEIRDAQRRAVAADPHAGLAVTIDLGERNDIHPINKREVGTRLARAARHLVYGEQIAASGPVPSDARLESGRVVVTFGDVEGKLVTASANQAIGFELCGAEKGSCRFASASVEADRVSIPLPADGATPARVRFCWGDSPFCNLSDGSGLPVGPFELAIQK